MREQSQSIGLATTRYDVAEHLRTPEEMEEYLKVAIELAAGDESVITKALDDIERARVLVTIAQRKCSIESD